MNEQPENKKRIVSKGQYVKALGTKAGIGTSGCFLWLLAFFCGFSTLSCFAAIFTDGGWLAAGGFLIFGFFTFFLGKVGLKTMEQSGNMDPGIPLTRKVAATLPAEESLVRASEEPVQEQQAILLRAATDNQETPAEQLVRPAGGQEP